MAYLQRRCPVCQRTDVMTHGITAQGKPRYRCKNSRGSSQTFLVEYSHQGRVPAVTQQMIEMTLTGSGSRDMARVLPISPTPVIEAFKKSTAASPHQGSSHPTDGAR
jgi:transposase-like protein